MVRKFCHIPEDSGLTWLEKFVTYLKRVTLTFLHVFTVPDKFSVSLR